MRLLLRATLLATAVAVALAAPAYGHAAYESSDPPDEGTVSSPPSEVSAKFSEPLNEADSYMDVTDPCGRDVGGETSITADSMTVDMSGTAEGEYVVNWRARSTIDNHPTTGEFQFTVTKGDSCPGEEKEEGTGGGAGGGNDNESSGSDSVEGGTVAAAGTGSNEGHKGHSKGQHDKHGRGVRRGSNGNGGNGEQDLAAGAAPEEKSGSRSALDGIPVGGLIVTLIMAAVIGAAAGKIYFSLSGEAG